MSRVPSHLRASLDLNAVSPDGTSVVTETVLMPEAGKPLPADQVAQIQQDATLQRQPFVDAENVENVENVEAAPSNVPTHEITCMCGQILVHIDHASHAAILHVFERNVLRPHALVDGDLPLNWRCHACGQVTTIGAGEA